MDSPISARAMTVLSRAAKRQVQNEQLFILKHSGKYHNRDITTSGECRRRKSNIPSNRPKLFSAPAILRPEFTASQIPPPKIVVINPSQDSRENSISTDWNMRRPDNEFELASPKTPRSQEVTDRLNSYRQNWYQNLPEPELLRLQLSPDKFYEDTPRPQTGIGNNWAWVQERLASRESGITRTESSMTFTDFLEGLDQQSEDYDTDLEDNFVDYNIPEDDFTGVVHYQDICEGKNIAPSRQILQKLSEENEQFSLQHRCLNKRDAFALAGGLTHNTFIEHFNLSENCIGDDAAVPLVKMLKKNFYINRVDLSKNYLNGFAGHQLALMLQDNSTITHLCLSHNKLGDKEGIVLFEALRMNNVVEHLDLSHNQLTDLTGQAAAAVLMGNHDLMSLNLSWNMLGKMSAAALGKALKTNFGLKSLDLSWNGLGDEGVTLLAKPLASNTTLRLLSLAVNHIGPFGAEKLALGVCGGRARHSKKSSCALRSLILDRNPLGTKGLSIFLKHMEQSENLTDLSIRDVVIAPEINSVIKKLITSSNASVLYEGQCELDKAASAIQGGGVILHKVLKEKKIDPEEYFSSLSEHNNKTVDCNTLKIALSNVNTVSELEIERLVDQLDVKRKGFICYNEISKYALKLPTIKKATTKRRKKKTHFKL